MSGSDGNATSSQDNESRPQTSNSAKFARERENEEMAERLKQLQSKELPPIQQAIDDLEFSLDRYQVRIVHMPL